MTRHYWQAGLAVAVWTPALMLADVPWFLAILVPVDVALFGLAFLAWRHVETAHDG